MYAAKELDSDSLSVSEICSTGNRWRSWYRYQRDSHRCLVINIILNSIFCI